MITINKLSWRNFFSYSDKVHTLDLSKETLVQIKGTNGSGKSSIPVILEETLFGKNSKGFKKSELANRYTGTSDLWSEVELDIDGDSYVVTLIRKSTLKVTLFKNGIDISSHTATNTYKDIETVLGIDFKTFTQLIYQSSTYSLEFLTATDTNRKRFLVALFGLDHYLCIHEKFKKIHNDSTMDIKTVTGASDTYKNLISSIENQDFSVKPIVSVETLPDADIEEVSKLKTSLLSIEHINTKINKNNQYKIMLSKIDSSLLTENTSIIDTKPWSEEMAKLAGVKSTHEATLAKITKLTERHKCPTCYQDIDKKQVENLCKTGTDTISALNGHMDDLQYKISTANRDNIKAAKAAKAIQDFESYSNLIDNSIATDVLDKTDLDNQIKILEGKIASSKARIAAAIKANTAATDHNSKIDGMLTHLEEYKRQLAVKQEEAIQLSDINAKLDLIKKSFGTNGLVSYKLEYVIKDLERQINEYLIDLSDGRFQLIFVVSGDKLNIDIIDNGNTVTITALSAGELSRVNTATLLAIRKLMSQISTTKLNILFLDEILGVLDDNGKEKVSEILMSEDLNTFIISHEWEHPLVTKIYVTKENNLSTLSYG